jgi:hypothetical protein
MEALSIRDHLTKSGMSLGMNFLLATTGDTGVDFLDIRTCEKMVLDK